MKTRMLILFALFSYNVALAQSLEVVERMEPTLPDPENSLNFEPPEPEPGSYIILDQEEWPSEKEALRARFLENIRLASHDAALFLAKQYIEDSEGEQALYYLMMAERFGSEAAGDLLQGMYENADSNTVSAFQQQIDEFIQNELLVPITDTVARAERRPRGITMLERGKYKPSSRYMRRGFHHDLRLLMVVSPQGRVVEHFYPPDFQRLHQRNIEEFVEGFRFSENSGYSVYPLSALFYVMSYENVYRTVNRAFRNRWARANGGNRASQLLMGEMFALLNDKDEVEFFQYSLNPSEPPLLYVESAERVDLPEHLPRSFLRFNNEGQPSQIMGVEDEELMPEGVEAIQQYFAEHEVAGLNPEYTYRIADYEGDIVMERVQYLPQNAKSRYWLERAARQGSLSAQVRLAIAPRSEEWLIYLTEHGSEQYRRLAAFQLALGFNSPELTQKGLDVLSDILEENPNDELARAIYLQVDTNRN